MFQLTKHLPIAAFAALGLIALGLATPAAAQTSGVLVVDSDRLWQETKAGKDAQRQLREWAEKLGKQVEEEIARQKEAIDKAAADQKLDDKQKEARIRQIEQVLSENFQVILNQAQQSARKQFKDSIRPVLFEVMRDKSGELLVDKGLVNDLVLANSDSVEITNAAMQRIEIKLPKLEVDLPKIDEEPKGEEQGPAPAPKKN